MTFTYIWHSGWLTKGDEGVIHLGDLSCVLPNNPLTSKFHLLLPFRGVGHFAECHSAEGRFAEGHFAEWFFLIFCILLKMSSFSKMSTKRPPAKRPSVKWHSAKWHSAKWPSVKRHSAKFTRSVFIYSGEYEKQASKFEIPAVHSKSQTATTSSSEWIVWNIEFILCGSFNQSHRRLRYAHFIHTHIIPNSSWIIFYLTPEKKNLFSKRLA